MIELHAMDRHNVYENPRTDRYLNICRHTNYYRFHDAYLRFGAYRSDAPPPAHLSVR